MFALELPHSEEAALRAYVNGEIDTAAMLQSDRFWQRNRDGRNSGAMFAMLSRIRTLKRAGLDVEVIAALPSGELSEQEAERLFDRFPLPPEADRQGSLHELRMAAAVMDGAARLEAQRAIFLVGDAHAVIAPSPSSSWNSETGEFRQFIRMHAAAAMPRESTLSLVFTHAGGDAFVQTQNGAGAPPLEASEPALMSPNVVIAPYPADNPRYDGRVFVGRVTASPPVTMHGAAARNDEGGGAPPASRRQNSEP
jgi:hypothetical protein